MRSCRGRVDYPGEVCDNAGVVVSGGWAFEGTTVAARR
jgi:hypothetical protein